MKKIVLLLLIPLLCGCYSSEVLPSGASDYTVKSRGNSFEQAKQDSTDKANKYCSDSGLYFIELSEKKIMVKNKFEHQLKFQCLKETEYTSHENRHIEI